MKKMTLLSLWVFFPLLALSVNESTTVVRVVDGDTVIVDRNGTDARLRIVGIDTPEIVAQNRPVGCFGAEASAYAKSLLPIGSHITLEHENETDKYDRLLAYITLPNNTDFGLVMIQDGYSYAYRSFNHNRKTRYVAAEAQARFNKVGLWADNACRDDQQAVVQTTKAWQGYISFFEQLIKAIASIIKLFN